MGCIGSKEVQEGLAETKKVQNQPSQNGTKAASTAQQQKQKQVEPVDSQKSYTTDDASAGSGLGPGQKPLDKNFGFSKNIALKYDIEEEIGRGHFGHTCAGRIRKGDNKGQRVAIKIIPKGKMTSALAVQDVKREVKILRGLEGHDNIVKYYDAYEDNVNVYIVMELCEGGELLDRILARGGRFSEKDTQDVVRQILGVVAWCHLQGVVHRDLKPENFLYSTKADDAPLKAIDFGLSDFVLPDAKLDDIVGSAYYVAPEVLHRCYSYEADVWSVGVITYILLCGSRPFWARTESGIFRSVLRADPNFVDMPWPSISTLAKDFVRRLMSKDIRRRLTAAQALTHPWLKSDKCIPPMDMAVVRSIRKFSKHGPLKKAALKAVSKTLREDEQLHARIQFAHCDADGDGAVTLADLRTSLTRFSTEAMRESRGLDHLLTMDNEAVGRMDYENFNAAIVNVHQLQQSGDWENRIRKAFESFDKDGNEFVEAEDLVKEMSQTGPMPTSTIIEDWTRDDDAKLNFSEFAKLLRSGSMRRRPQVKGTR